MKKQLILFVLVFASALFVFKANAQLSNKTRDYQERFETNLIGNFEMIGNVNVDCSNCYENNDAGSTNPPQTNNPPANMVYSNIDSDPNTVNSSMANLNLPAGAIVKWAALYWGGVYEATGDYSCGTYPADPSLVMDQVMLKVPGAANYSPVIATVRNKETTQFSGWKTFMAHADITNIVKNAGSGDYYVL